MKNSKLWPFNVHAPKWHMAYFVPIDGHFEKLVDKDFRFVLPGSYLNFDIQTNFEVNQTEIGHSIPKNSFKKINKMAISQNQILPNCHSPKSLLHLHFSMNLSESFKINVNMDFAHTNRAY